MADEGPKGSSKIQLDEPVSAIDITDQITALIRNKEKWLPDGMTAAMFSEAVRAINEWDEAGDGSADLAISLFKIYNRSS